MTFRPLGPSVTLTALLRMSTPRSKRSRASVENLTSLAAMTFNPFVQMKGETASSGLFLRGASALEHAHDVGLFHDQEVLTVDLDLRARPFAEQNSLARLE